MSKQAFDRKMEAIEAVRLEPDPAVAAEKVRKALRDRSNYLVSKAARVAADLSLVALVPDLAAAFERFLVDPLESDPQCWAKNAIVKALRDLGYREAAFYLRGLVYVQLEPVWGGRADSAATLRGTCALALVECPIDDFELLTHLTGALADAEKPVRIDTAVAISQLGRAEGALLLRLKVLLGDAEPEVMGQCFASLLSLAPADSVAFVGRFLKALDEDVCLEAAGALAQSREVAAIELLKGFWRGRLPGEVRSAFLVSLGASPLVEAAEFLLSIVVGEWGELAAGALGALGASRFRGEMRERIRAVVAEKQDEGLRRIFAERFGGGEGA